MTMLLSELEVPIYPFVRQQSNVHDLISLSQTVCPDRVELRPWTHWVPTPVISASAFLQTGSC